MMSDTSEQIVKVYAYKRGSFFTYVGIKPDGREVQLRRKSTRLYTKAYEFDHRVTSCSGDPVSSCFLYSGKNRSFSGKQPIKTHQILYKGDYLKK